MKSQKTLIILVLALVAVIGGAALLYGGLADQAPGAQLTAADGAAQADTPSDDGGAPREDAASRPASGETEPTAEDAPAGADETREESAPAGEEAREEERQLAPDFKVYDREGNAYRLSDFRGKPVVVNFWASWCGPCKSEMPDFDQIYQEYGEDVHFLMVNLTDGARETREVAEEYVKENGYAFPVYYDTDRVAYMSYGVYSIPQTYLIDAEGYVMAYAMGAIDGDVLKQAFSELFALPGETAQ